MEALVYDLGGTHLRCGVLDSDGVTRCVRKERIANFLGGHDAAFVWATLFSRMLQFERSVRDRMSKLAPVVVAFPGPIRAHRSILDAPTVLGATRNFPDVCAELEQRMNRPVYLLNDISAAAFHLSAQTAARRFMVVTVSSGIGSKLYDRDTQAGVIDDPAYAGEIGHVVVDFTAEAPACDCGGTGHLGAISSGRGVERLARRRGQLDPEGFSRSQCVRRFGARADSLCNEAHVVPAILAGDEWTTGVLRSSMRPLATVLLSVAMAAGIEEVIIIGGFALTLGPIYLQLLRTLIEEACDYSVVSGVLPYLVRLGPPGEETCLEGAAAYARRLVAVRQ